MTIDSEVEQIFEKYGYFLGLAYEDDNGNLATHKAGKVKEAILNLIAQEANKARLDELERLDYVINETLSHTNQEFGYTFFRTILKKRQAQLTEKESKQ